MGIPTFKGFEDNKFQQHDSLIERLVIEFNENPAGFVDALETQLRTTAAVTITLLSTGISIPQMLSTTLVKAWLIQETGGGDARSQAAWAVDPAQVNVPGDFTQWKTSLGLVQPFHRNSGLLEDNVRAGISWLTRKGFGTSGQPPRNTPMGVFEGWRTALERYNGRTVTTSNGKRYRENYAQRIIDRANTAGVEYKIELPKPGPKHPTGYHGPAVHHAPARRV